MVAVAFDREQRGELDPCDPFVRQLWTVAVGAAPLAEMLRLMVAAGREGAIRRPIHMVTLLREGLVRSAGGRIIVPRRLPDLNRAQIRRLPPWLRAARLRHLGGRRP